MPTLMIAAFWVDAEADEAADLAAEAVQSVAMRGGGNIVGLAGADVDRAPGPLLHDLQRVAPELGHGLPTSQAMARTEARARRARAVTGGSAGAKAVHRGSQIADIVLTDADGDALKLRFDDAGQMTAKTVHEGRPDPTRVFVSLGLQRDLHRLLGVHLAQHHEARHNQTDPEGPR
jgi:YD repeat-containing protein